VLLVFFVAGLNGIRLCSVPFALFVADNGDGLPDTLWGVLHRAIDLVADSGHAARQAGRGALRATAAGLSLRLVRQARASGGVYQPAADRNHVPRITNRSARLSCKIGSADFVLSRCLSRSSLGEGGCETNWQYAPAYLGTLEQSTQS